MLENIVEISNGIGYSSTIWDLSVDEHKYVEHLLSKHGLNDQEQTHLKSATTTQELAQHIQALDQETDKQSALRKEIESMRDSSLKLAVIDFLQLSKLIPAFFYTSHYDRMAGEISLDKLAKDKNKGSLSIEDKIFLDFLEYAGTSIEELKDSSKYENLKAKCEGASNEITDEIFNFWSQNQALTVVIDIGEGKSGDKPPFNSGTIVKIRINNQHHRVSVPLSERSAGFVWFFSFLSQFKQLQNTTGNAVLLLDEPGLTLHGKAQSDLLKYIQERLLPDHQVIYTTHSPFMVPADRLADVRVVEDVIEQGGNKSRTIGHGTKVSSDVLSVDKDTLFPLQGHLGYELTQSLFIGKNTLLVEGPSDILYLQALSQALKNRSREGLSPNWTICPTGGIDKIYSFASLFGGNKLNIAVLCDFVHGEKKKVERLKENQILKSDQIFTVTNFTGKDESDIEDIFHADIYSEILNKAYSLSGKNVIDASKLSASTPQFDRIVKQAENVFKLMSTDIPEFDHFTPSNWLIRNPKILESDSEQVMSTLNVAEAVFKTFNALLK